MTPMLTPRTSEPHFQRIYSFDLLRIFFIFAIVMLHAWEHFVGEDSARLAAIPSNYVYYQKYVGTTFNYAALFALSLSFLLWGLKDFKLRKIKILIFCLGFVGLQLRVPTDPFDFASWSWEVYGFLFVAVLVCRFWSRKWKAILGLWIASILMLFIPVETWMPMADQIVEPWRTLLFANLETSATIGWFLIPWIFVPTLAFTTGQILKQRPSVYQKLVQNSFSSAALLSLVSVVLFFLKPNPVPPMLGNHFYQFLFMQSPLHFWNHFLLFGAAIILCFRWEMTGWPQRSSLRYLSYLQWNKNFFLCYFFHFSVIVFLLSWKEEIINHRALLDWLWVIIFLLTEIIMQLFVRILLVYAFLGKWVWRRLRTRVVTSESRSN